MPLTWRQTRAILGDSCLGGFWATPRLLSTQEFCHTGSRTVQRGNIAQAPVPELSRLRVPGSATTFTNITVFADRAGGFLPAGAVGGGMDSAEPISSIQIYGYECHKFWAASTHGRWFLL